MTVPVPVGRPPRRRAVRPRSLSADAGPLAVSPGVYGIAAARTGGVVVLLFGGPILGLREVPATERVQLYRVHPMTSDAALSAGGPPPTATTLEAFFCWYVGRLNRLFTHVLDPARFRTAAGHHDIGRHFAAALSVERLFLCTPDLLAGVGRLEFIRQLLLFQATTTFADLTRVQGSVLFTLRAARRRLDNLVAALPSEAVTVIAPRCLDALAALEHVQRGFYLPSGSKGADSGAGGSMGRGDDRPRPGGRRVSLAPAERDARVSDQVENVHLRPTRRGCRPTLSRPSPAAARRPAPASRTGS